MFHVLHVSFLGMIPVAKSGHYFSLLHYHYLSWHKNQINQIQIDLEHVCLSIFIWLRKNSEVAVVSAVPPQQQGLASNPPRPGLFCAVFACSPHVCVWFPPTVHKRTKCCQIKFAHRCEFECDWLPLWPRNLSVALIRRSVKTDLLAPPPGRFVYM